MYTLQLTSTEIQKEQEKATRYHCGQSICSPARQLARDKYHFCSVQSKECKYIQGSSSGRFALSTINSKRRNYYSRLGGRGADVNTRSCGAKKKESTETDQISTYSFKVNQGDLALISFLKPIWL